MEVVLDDHVAIIMINFIYIFLDIWATQVVVVVAEVVGVAVVAKVMLGWVDHLWGEQ